MTSADVCLSSPAAKSRIEAPETKFAWSAQRLSPVSRPATKSGNSRGSKSLSNIKESLYKSKERTEEYVLPSDEDGRRHLINTKKTYERRYSQAKGVELVLGSAISVLSDHRYRTQNDG